MKKLLVVAFLFLLALMSAVVFSVKQAPPPITNLYVFGDSLSDTGASFRSGRDPHTSSTLYSQGRFSNGRVWVEYLADELSIAQVDNFAYGGATTGGSASTGVPGLLAQVQSFTQGQPEVPSEALYVLWAGANDYLQGMANTAAPVANIAQAVESLAQGGATRIVVGNLPDLGLLPATRNSGYSSELSALTRAHNSALRRSLKALQQQYQDAQIVTLDAHSLYQQAIADPAKFGFTQVTSACLSSSGACRNPDQFLFWDGIHPTTAGHRILADTTAATLRAELSLPIQS